jgi:hypothetical protein
LVIFCGKLAGALEQDCWERAIGSWGRVLADVAGLEEIRNVRVLAWRRN